MNTFHTIFRPIVLMLASKDNLLRHTPFSIMVRLRGVITLCLKSFNAFSWTLIIMGKSYLSNMLCAKFEINNISPWQDTWGVVFLARSHWLHIYMCWNPIFMCITTNQTKGNWLLIVKNALFLIIWWQGQRLLLLSTIQLQGHYFSNCQDYEDL